SDGVERAPRVEVEKGQEAAGDNDGYFGLGHAKGAGGYGGADEEDGEGDAAAPYFNQPGGSGVARQLRERNDKGKAKRAHQGKTIGDQQRRNPDECAVVGQVDAKPDNPQSSGTCAQTR